MAHVELPRYNIYLIVYLLKGEVKRVNRFEESWQRDIVFDGHQQRVAELQPGETLEYTSIYEPGVIHAYDQVQKIDQNSPL